MEVEMDKLIDKVVGLQPGLNKLDVMYVVTFIRQNVHLVAKVCPECEGFCGTEPYKGYHPENCQCKGHGVVPVKE
jgi:hypothetical protein